MVLYMIGIGLNDEMDITFKGLEAVQRCAVIYLESYTSTLQCPVEKLEKFYGKKVILAGRELVEKEAGEILGRAKEKDVAFLVIGDPFGATTHTDLFLRAKKGGIKVEVIHNASILNAVGITGLELYKFGRTTSIPFPQENYHPSSYYDVIAVNRKAGSHTLVLLDLKPDEKKFMTVSQGFRLLLAAEKLKKRKVVLPTTKALGVARAGGDSMVRYGKVQDLMLLDFGNPPHCIIIPGKLHFMEEEALEQWKAF